MRFVALLVATMFLPVAASTPIAETSHATQVIETMASSTPYQARDMIGAASLGHPFQHASPDVWAPIFLQEGYAQAVRATQSGDNETSVNLYEAGDIDGDGRGDRFVQWTVREAGDDSPDVIEYRLVAKSAAGQTIWQTIADPDEGHVGLFGDMDEDGVIDAFHVDFDKEEMVILNGRDGVEMARFKERFTGEFHPTLPVGTYPVSSYTFRFEYQMLADRFDGMPGAFVFDVKFSNQWTRVGASAVVAYASVSHNTYASSIAVGTFNGDKVDWWVQHDDERRVDVIPIGDVDGKPGTEFLRYDDGAGQTVSTFAYSPAGWQMYTTPVGSDGFTVELVGEEGIQWSYKVESDAQYAMVTSMGDYGGKGHQFQVVLLQETPLGLEMEQLILDSKGQLVQRSAVDHLPLFTVWDDLDGDGDTDAIVAHIDLETYEVTLVAVDEKGTIKWSREVTDEYPHSWFPGAPAWYNDPPQANGDGIRDVPLIRPAGSDLELIMIDAVTGEELWTQRLEQGDAAFIDDLDGDGISEAAFLRFPDGTNADGRLHLQRASDLKEYWNRLVRDQGDSRTIEQAFLSASAGSDVNGDGMADITVNMGTYLSYSVSCGSYGCEVDRTQDPWDASYVLDGRTGKSIASYLDRLPTERPKDAAPVVQRGELAELIELPQEQAPGLPVALVIMALAALAYRPRRNQ